MDISSHKIGVIMGGVSAERDVSLKSGQAVSRALKELGLSHVDIDAGKSLCKQVVDEGITLAFIALHGGWGEDGSLQGMLNIMEIPFTGSGVLASALAMNKEVSKTIFMSSGIKVAPFFVIDGRYDAIRDELYERRGYEIPLFIKPVSEGSSVGVTFVKEKSGFERAVREALSYGDRVIVEKYIKGKEVQIGILNDKTLGGVEVRPSAEFYDYKSKYKGGTEYILPPEISEATYTKAQEMALQAHISLGCAGATRVDLIIDGSRDIYVLEVNTIPGMTETSLLPKIAGMAGLEFKELIRAMLIDALRTGGVE
jgi:D-alanine-D-alanine ligase